MATPERGTKRQCLNCSTKFYDLNRDPILCPSCGKEFVAQVASTTSAPAAKKAEKPKTDVVETDVAAEEAGAEVISINDVESDDDDDDDADESIPDVDDVEVDDELSGDQQDVFLEEDDDEDAVIGVAVPTDDDET